MHTQMRLWFAICCYLVHIDAAYLNCLCPCCWHRTCGSRWWLWRTAKGYMPLFNSLSWQLRNQLRGQGCLDSPTRVGRWSILMKHVWSTPDPAVHRVWDSPPCLHCTSNDYNGQSDACTHADFDWDQIDCGNTLAEVAAGWCSTESTGIAFTCCLYVSSASLPAVQDWRAKCELCEPVSTGCTGCCSPGRDGWLTHSWAQYKMLERRPGWYWHT